MASKKIKINITLNDTKIQTSTQKIHQMCTNTKIHAALLKTKQKTKTKNKTKTQNIAKLKYLVHKNKKTKNKNKLYVYKLQ
jgi:hypothetical protein